MKFDYMVKRHGVYYRAGEEVPEMVASSMPQKAETVNVDADTETVVEVEKPQATKGRKPKAKAD